MPRGGNRLINLTGQKFGYLTVQHRVENRHGRVCWLCQCDCGKQTVASTKKLRNGEKISCGHLREVELERQRRAGYEAKRVEGVAAFLLSPQRKVRTDSVTGITGVKITHTRAGEVRYVATITVGGVRHHLGTYRKIEEAVEARRRGEEKFIPKRAKRE